MRDNKHLVGVVMGGISVPSRDREMMRILSEGFRLRRPEPDAGCYCKRAVARRQTAVHQSVQVRAARLRPSLRRFRFRRLSAARPLPRRAES